MRAFIEKWLTPVGVVVSLFIAFMEILNLIITEDFIGYFTSHKPYVSTSTAGPAKTTSLLSNISSLFGHGLGAQVATYLILFLLLVLILATHFRVCVTLNQRGSRLDNAGTLLSVVVATSAMFALLSLSPAWAQAQVWQVSYGPTGATIENVWQTPLWLGGIFLFLLPSFLSMASVTGTPIFAALFAETLLVQAISIPAIDTHLTQYRPNLIPVAVCSSETASYLQYVPKPVAAAITRFRGFALPYPATTGEGKQISLYYLPGACISTRQNGDGENFRTFVFYGKATDEFAHCEIGLIDGRINMAGVNVVRLVGRESIFGDPCRDSLNSMSFPSAFLTYADWKAMEEGPNGTLYFWNIPL